MASVTAAMVAELRDKTDEPMMQCKRALIDAGGDMDLAEQLLRTEVIVPQPTTPVLKAWALAQCLAVIANAQGGSESVSLQGYNQSILINGRQQLLDLRAAIDFALGSEGGDF